MDVKREWFEKDYYAVLGVASTASEKEIQNAYRKLARELHPDANPDDSAAEERFKEVSAAYDVVGDSETREQYDSARRVGPGAMGGNPFAGSGGPGGAGGFTFDGGDIGDLSDLLGGMFGGAGGSPFGAGGGQRPRRGHNQEAQLRLSFDESVAGVTTSVTVGGGSDGGTRSIKVRIPAGVEDGQKIRLAGKGGPGQNGGPAGDLFVVVLVNDHPVFGRDGRNLTLDLPITFDEAALGTDIKVPTYGGESVKLRLPSGTQPGRTFRVKGHGITKGGSTGDLMVTVQVAVPSKLSKAQRTALEAFSEASSESPRQHLET
ncbi:MAG: DnaJ C-terminal domain-containing protein [Acidimicrobiales bacterium]